jgi:hypothetical protein
MHLLADARVRVGLSCKRFNARRRQDVSDPRV